MVYLHVILRLRVPQLKVFSVFIGYKLVVRAGLYYSAVVEHGDPVAEPAGSEPVADIYCGFAAYDLVESRINFVFRYRIERSGGLVKNYERRFFV